MDFPACSERILKDTNSQMAINRNWGGQWSGFQQGQFPGQIPNGVLSQQCSCQGRIFIKTAWRRQDEKPRLERYKIIAEVETSAPSPRSLITIILATKDWADIWGHVLSISYAVYHPDLARTLGSNCCSHRQGNGSPEMVENLSRSERKQDKSLWQVPSKWPS